MTRTTKYTDQFENDSIGTTREEYAAQGVSNNFIRAQEAGRMTVGEAAKILTKRLGRKVLASQLEPLASEWHHAGRFGRGQARRVFFLSEAQVDAITEADLDWSASSVYGWSLGFEPGVRGWVPIIAHAGTFDRAKAKRLGNKFHELSREEAEEAASAIGKRLPPFCSNWREAR